jgi:hypothetical protein
MSDQPDGTGDVIDARGSQGFIYRPGGPITQTFTTVVAEETAYDVSSLPSPYPGLRSYTYADRAAYAGREAAVQEAVARITDPAGRQPLTFITGVSGSGKSSFAQAGLLPALEAYYADRGRRAGRGIFRPSGSPLAMLGDALVQLGLPEQPRVSLESLTPPVFARLLAEATPAGQVNLLLIDQFEELFSQSPAEQSQLVFALLEDLPPFEQAHTHILATLRSDYLDELFNHPVLWQAAVQRGIELRAMSLEELRLAILSPLEARAQQNKRFLPVRFEPGLLRQLAEDAAADTAYLPLLQVALQELWAGGSLKLERYQGLAQAIQQRAEKVYAFHDHDRPVPDQPRPPEEQAELLSIFVDLVNVSLDDDPRRDVRRRRARAALQDGRPARKELIDDLVDARLLSAGLEKGPDGQVDTVDIIHESLLQKWDRLRGVVREQRDLLRRRARFEQELAAWLANNRSDEYLLLGIHLKEARQLSQAQDISFRGRDSGDFLQRSERLALALQRAPVLQRLFMFLAAGGAAGFALAFGITYFSQTVIPALFLFLLAIELVPGLLGSGLYALGLILPVWRGLALSRNRYVLAGGLAGAAGFALMLLVNSILNSRLGLLPLLGALVEGALWGLPAGAGVAWYLVSRRPAWQSWAAAGLVSGLVLLIGESFGQAFQRPNIGGSLAFWQVFLAGAVVPLAMLLAARLGRIQTSLRDLVGP